MIFALYKPIYAFSSICFVVDETGGTRQDVHAPAVNLTELKKTTALREKMAVMREKRRMNVLLGYELLGL